MKELSIEQKAKAYDEALKVLHKYDGANIMFSQSLKEEMFPELRESEDERIRKALINGFNKFDKSAVWYNGITNGQILDWLEKQGEHANFRNKIQIGDKVTRNEDGMLVNLSQLNRVAKPAAEVEPKFKIGDWITDGNITVQIEAIKNDCYLYCGDCVLYSTKTADKVYHLWTIQDAKDGDVLMSRAPFIYGKPIPYGGLDWYNEKFIKASNYVFKDSPVHPATKEQRNLLFQKMKEAGYEWDAEKKELKKVEQNLIDNYCVEHCKGYQETGKCFADGECKAKRDAEQKPTWSEEDEEMLKMVIKLCEQCGNEYAYYWLKSLKERYTWKPSDKQMNAFDAILVYNPPCSDECRNHLITLYNELKKLREE